MVAIARMLRIRHSLRLVAGVAVFAGTNRIWWPLLILPFVAAALFAAGTTTVVVPYAVYSLF